MQGERFLLSSLFQGEHSGWFWWEPFKMSNLDMLSIQASLNNGVGIIYRVDPFVITLGKIWKIASFTAPSGPSKHMFRCRSVQISTWKSFKPCWISVFFRLKWDVRVAYRRWSTWDSRTTESNLGIVLEITFQKGYDIARRYS